MQDSERPLLKQFTALGGGLLPAVLALSLATLAWTALGRPASAGDDLFSDQAEWAQSYDADARLAVPRSTTPILSSATFDATEQAIARYQQIVTSGGWNMVPRAAR